MDFGSGNTIFNYIMEYTDFNAYIERSVLVGAQLDIEENGKISPQRNGT